MVEREWLMLNKHKRWFHASRVNFPFVNMSASWFLVSMYLIWMMESKLIRFNNQSRATLWVLETCLIVGLLLFMIILIKNCPQTHTTKHLDARTGRLREQGQHYPNHWSIFEIACACESCEVENKLYVSSTTGLSVLSGSESCFQELKQSDPIDQEREYHLKPQSCIQRNDFWFCWAVRNWSLSSCTSNFLEQMYDFQKKHNVPPEGDFESSSSPAKSESWNRPNLHCFAVLPT